MNWEAVGAIGEVFGAIGVVMTLVYLATQVRQNSQNLDHNTRAVIAATEITGGEQVMMGRLPIAESGELADLLVRGGTDFRSLDAVEKLRFSSFWQAALIAHQGYFFQHQRGLLNDDVWSSFSLQFNNGVRTAGFRQWWEPSKDLFEARFQAYIEAKAREG